MQITEFSRLVELNDVHSRLNPTRVLGVLRPRSIAELVRIVRGAVEEGGSLSVGGSRHAMGGQQFRSGTHHLDTTGLASVLELDRERGLVTVEAGITWPALIDELERLQAGQTGRRWSIRQKQTGADRLTMGGALAANVHGRGLHMKPIIDDVERFTLVTAKGELIECSRETNRELFSLAIGGYGMFGVIATVTLRLAERVAVRRIVRVTDIDAAAASVRERLHTNLQFGDFQFEVDPASSGFLTRGVFACYEKVDEVPKESGNRELRPEDWQKLLLLAHTEKTRAFEHYSSHYCATDGQIYWSDTHQLGVYLDGYHDRIDELSGCPGSEMISELYVPPERIGDFLRAASEVLRELRANVIYGTVRLIHKDEESFLPWAKETFACVIFNLHVDHTPRGIEHTGKCFRALIDLALEYGGSFYLTYHRFATPEQLLKAYPQLPTFVEAKRRSDPAGVFDSEWWRWIEGALDGAHSRKIQNLNPV